MGNKRHVSCARNAVKMMYGITTHSFSSKNKRLLPPHPISAAGHNNVNVFMDIFFNMSNTQNKVEMLNGIEIVGWKLFFIFDFLPSRRHI
jgi:hypothetical protein